MGGGRVPAAEEEERFWGLVEAAWGASGAEVARARRALASRAPGTEAWDLLGVVDGALGAFLRELAGRCGGASAEELTVLDRVLERKLHEIDRADVHAVTDGSDDGFLYARGFIVAMGRDFYDAVVRDPQMAVQDADCEAMCYFFARLHQERFGDHPDTGSGITRESCSNPAGWPS
ncbi:DUF4240 domain-containing protein [Actinocorallia populi]|uniref:DUF4240 domain-containing protein n=1 Tax=Actinocorallia populi TaxID=2079200 RepID=UPI000D0891E9|nr:DUF4240 domain-containing protein [Actinocorallia populi]